MSLELVALREALIGSAPLIALIDAGKSKTPSELGGAIKWEIPTSGTGFVQWFTNISRYVSEAAWGDAALRTRSLLPALEQPFAQPLTAALKADKPDWTLLWEHIEKQRSKVFFRGKAAWNVEGLRAQVQKVLDELNDKFIDTAESCLAEMDFPKNDTMYTIPQPQIDAVIATVQPLSAQHASSFSSPPSLVLMEELRSRGHAMRKELAGAIRLEGNADFGAASALTGSAQMDMYKEAQRKFEIAMQSIEHAGTACANIAAVALLTKEYKLAIRMTERCFEALMAVHFEPVSYADKRTVMVIAFRQGERSPLPGHVPPKIAPAEGKAQKALMFKVLMRKARAFAALALQCFENDGVWVEDNRMDARGYFEDAKDAYLAAPSMDPKSPVPQQEFLAFMEKYDTILDEYEEANEELEVGEEDEDEM